MSADMYRTVSEKATVSDIENGGGGILGVRKFKNL